MAQVPAAMGESFADGIGQGDWAIGCRLCCGAQLVNIQKSNKYSQNIRALYIVAHQRIDS
jgi:hypothetical protein